MKELMFATELMLIVMTRLEVWICWIQHYMVQKNNAPFGLGIDVIKIFLLKPVDCLNRKSKCVNKKRKFGEEYYIEISAIISGLKSVCSRG